RSGVAIGDVGRITPDREFDFFFNIYLPADHPINGGDVPGDFSPLEPYTQKDIFHTDFEPGDHVSSPSAHKLDLESPLKYVNPSICAILVLPHGVHLKKLENLGKMQEYFARNAESWYRYSNNVRGRGLANGALYLVTGCEKSPSWGMVS
ncbi:hypothetical protein DFH07DRAFT_700158, partial [Mycena maculata]